MALAASPRRQPVVSHNADFQAAGDRRLEERHGESRHGIGKTATHRPSIVGTPRFSSTGKAPTTSGLSRGLARSDYFLSAAVCDSLLGGPGSELNGNQERLV